VNKGETGDINQATISFIGSTNNTVETYIQKTNADNLQFSIQKDTNQNDQGIIIGELCSLAVKTANKNTIFNIPDSLDDEKITLISTAFENAIAQAIHDGLFTKENCPTVGHPEVQESKASQTLRK